MATRVVITHLNGSKANQVEQWPFDTVEQITIGREAGSTVAFDQQRDDLVSRRHAVIRIGRGAQVSCRIADLGSSNGTLVNGAKITQEIELLPGDVVQLGNTGPKFTFDLQPRPPGLMERTRVAPLVGALEGTRRAPLEPPPQPPPVRPQAPPLQAAPMPPVPPPQRSGSSGLWILGILGLLVLLGAGGGALYFSSRVGPAKEMSPVEIAQNFGNATAYIRLQWRLYDQETGKRIFHKMVIWKGQTSYVPAYVKFSNGAITRWLVTDNEDRRNEVIGADGSGSGFVVDSQGFILTNKHVAAGWQVEYGFRPYEGNGGVLFTLDNNFHLVDVNTFDPTDSGALQHWVPDSGGVLFDSKAPVPVSASTHLFEGRNELLEARFPGQRVSYPSRLIRASADADVAEIRVDSVQGLPFVALEQQDNVRVGEKITVMGYPGISEQTIATIVTQEVGRTEERQELIPEPTVTDGLIARLGRAVQQQGSVVTAGTMGDVYQLTVLATGAGNSGGPVFNAAGKVIGLFTYARTRGTERVTFAVPIRYGRDLLAPEKVN